MPRHQTLRGRCVPGKSTAVGASTAPRRTDSSLYKAHTWRGPVQMPVVATLNWGYLRMSKAEPTADGRYVVIDGRRWRATDPSITADDARTLRAELMSARRAVKAALAAGDAEAERSAREQVHRTKVGLGERGVPWWEQSPDERTARVRQAVARIGTSRGEIGDTEQRADNG